MKQIFRASLVVLTLAGVYAGFSTPAPAATTPHKVLVSGGPETVPTCLGCGGGGGNGGTTTKAQ